MKFKLLEKVFDVVSGSYLKQTYYIYVNPTSQELRSKEDSKWNRGVIDENGDLYIEAKWNDSKDYSTDQKFSSWIHDDLLEHLHKKNKCLKLIEDEWHKDKTSVNYGVCVQRENDTLNFWIAESYNSWVIDFGKPQIEKLYDLAKKKNPYLNFHLKEIYYSTEVK